MSKSSPVTAAPYDRLLERLDQGADYQGYPEGFGDGWTTLCAEAARAIRNLTRASQPVAWKIVWENDEVSFVESEPCIVGNSRERVHVTPLCADTSTDREIERCQDYGQELPIRYPCHEQGCTIQCRFPESNSPVGWGGHLPGRIEP